MPSRLASRPQYSSASVGKHPTAAAGAGDGDDFAFQVGRGFDFRRGHDVADQLVDDAGDEHQIHAFGGRAQHRAGGRTGMQLGFAGGEGRHADRTIAHDDKGHLQTVAAKETLVLSHVIDRIAFAERAAGHDDFGERLGAVGAARLLSTRQKTASVRNAKFKFHECPPRARQ